MEIYYSGFMNPSRTRALSNYMHINKNSGVYLRAYGYSLWFPVFIEPDDNSYETNFQRVSVNLPAGFKAVVVGKLISETTEENRYTAVWKPGKIDLRDMHCSARNYKSIQKENISVYYTDNHKNAEQILDYTQKLKEFYYENLRKVHDTSSLYIVVLPKYGDISSHNVIGIQTRVYNNFDNDINSKYTIAHELVHPYVHIPVKIENPFSAFVIEGFPSFFDIYALHKLNGFDLAKYMLQVEKKYKNKKQTGKNQRGNPLPTEKPILEITYDEIGSYKDYFVLSDRVLLFLYHLWIQMGDENYDLFLKELFRFESIDYGKFEALIVKYIPGYEDNLNTWLNTNDYPESIHIINK